MDNQIETHRKPRLSFWQIWNMSFGFLGIQFGFALQQGNANRIFQTLNADIDQLAFLSLAGPITGMLVQPIIGYMSDRTWGKWGRRRPYFFFGAVLASLSLIGFPHASVLWIAAGMLWIMDASINISMEPFRAFVGDQLPSEQTTMGFAFQTFFIGVGSVIAFLLPWIFTHVFNVANTAPHGEIPESVKYAFYVGGAAFFLSVLWTVVSTKEYSPEELHRYNYDTAKEEEEPVTTDFKSFFKEYLNMPKTMAQLAVVQFFTWSALFTMWTYQTAAITRYIFNSTDTTSAAYNAGADWVGICGAVFSGFSAFGAFLLPYMAKKTSRKMTHMICLAVGGVSLIAVNFVTDQYVLLIPFLGIGLAWASILSMPYAILACTLPPNKMGVFMGMFNMFIVLPQAMCGLTLGWVLNHLFGGNSMLNFVLAGAFMLIAATAVIFVEDKNQ